MLTLDLKRRAQKFLAKLPPKHERQVVGKLAALLQDPFPPDSKQLKNSLFRGVDIGEYRIAYLITHEMLVVSLIGKRNDNDVYRRLERLEG
jgi:mRNA interferase RelE/StbE